MNRFGCICLSQAGHQALSKSIKSGGEGRGMEWIPTTGPVLFKRAHPSQISDISGRSISTFKHPSYRSPALFSFSNHGIPRYNLSYYPIFFIGSYNSDTALPVSLRNPSAFSPMPFFLVPSSELTPPTVRPAQRYSVSYMNSSFGGLY